MRFISICTLAFLTVTALLLPAEQPAEKPPAASIRVSTHYVLVDAIVTDKSGKPITDLKPSDFVVKENGKTQKLASFTLEQSGARLQAPQLPDGIFSNRPEYRMPQGPLTIVLIDALNTTVQNQALARRALLSYVSSQLRPSQQMAVYVLTTRLIRLQDFTTDPEVLRLALERYRPQSVATGAGADTSKQASPAMATLQSSSPRSTGAILEGLKSVQASLNLFEADSTAVNLEARIGETLAAMRSLARITGGHSGRKNLIWISEGLPVAMSPDEGATVTTAIAERSLDPTGPPPLANEGHLGGNVANQIHRQFLDEIHRTAAMLSEVETAIYPVDARGLIGSVMADASRTGLNESGLLMMGNDYGQHVSAAMGNISSSLENMREIARQTGGKALISRNDIDNAIAVAANDGSVYYNLGYASSNKKFDGGYRRINVEVTRPGAQVRHRPGYFAIDPATKGKQQDAETSSSVRNVGIDSTMIQFDAAVPSPPPAAGKATVPVRFLVDAKTINLGDGDKKQVNLDFFVVAVSSDSKIAANVGKTVSAPLEASQVEQIMKQGLMVPVDVELGPGQYQVRLAVRDNTSGMLGTLTAPLVVASK